MTNVNLSEGNIKVKNDTRGEAIFVSVKMI